MYKSQNYSAVPQASLTGPSFCTIQVCLMVALIYIGRKCWKRAMCQLFKCRLAPLIL